ncbi:LysR family transcriptional regulator [Ectothiorhodospira sp. BSL-9]|uniref:LysR family transcriptional regulator n=1 Tax=Ectothiorhodospira sp. BSL-9 TaxID=1442136 RepID=UPI0007B454C1|nr:LysR family transcriptional regulator [Ectothiorhodospira sp. BSL-9]ANB03933.1 hypothetical protein ECTOBSL9_2923 [Ectothiorhodospira sp. BSL-9]
MLDIRHLRALKEVQRTGSITVAAQTLCVTQSALSHQFRQLEEHLGMTLFVRKSRPVRLTAAGQRLMRAAEQILPELAAVERDLARMRQGHGGRLFLALECHSCFQWLMPTLAAFREHWPEVELDLTLSHGFAPIQALREGEIDAVVSADPVEDPAIEYLALFEYENRLIVPCGHPLADAPFIKPEDLSGETLITYPVEPERLDICHRFLWPAGLDLPRRTTELTAMLVQLVASRRGVASLPDWALREFTGHSQAPRLSSGSGVIDRPLGPKGLWSVLRVGLRRADLELSYLRDFIGIARDQLHQLRESS